MEFKEISAPSLQQLFVDELQQMVLSGQLKPGQKLPPQRELARQSKVSLSVVNAGINRLAERGFVRIVPRQGVYVADLTREGNAQTLVSLLNYTSAALDKNLLRPIVDLRTALEPQIVRLACQNADAQENQRLDGLCSQMEQASDPDELARLTFEFHHEVAIASGNVVYPMVVNTFRDVYVSFFRATEGVYPRQDALAFYRRMAGLIARGKTDTAVSTQQEELARWYEYTKE